MKIVKNILKSGVVASLLFWASACDKFDLDVNTDPNNPATTKVDLLLTQIEYSLMNNLAGGMNDAQHGIMGLISSFDDYNMPATTWNFTWNTLYSNVIKDLEGLIAASVEDPSISRAENPHYLGIAQALKAYTYITMVDLFGDVPFSEAAKGDATEAIKFPKFDNQEAIYRDCKALIDAAAANLAKPSGVSVAGDVIYGGNNARWRAFVNTLKLKVAMTTRLVDPGAAKTEIESFFATGAPATIADAAGDFQFQFSKLVAPDNRHPWYVGPYTGGEFTYISCQLMVEMIDDEDPRFPFYFRRQTKKILDPTNPTDKGTIPCSSIAGCTYAYVVLNQAIIDELYNNEGKTFGTTEKEFLAGIFGRDRSDPSGVPADGSLRTIPGVYPCGGYYDVAAPALPAANKAPGGGIFPALTHIDVLYYRIEAALAMGAATGDPRANFESAIRKHIDKVVKFGVATDQNSVTPTAAAIDAYVATWMARYDAGAAISPNAALNVVMKQRWFSSWGAAYELWNAYRRTALPTTLQIPLNPLRNDPYRFPYPQNELSLNPNAANYKSVVYDVDKIFWDKN